MSEKIDNRMKQAAALTYDELEQSAPKVIAKGSGEIADEIIQLAKEHNIPIQEDPTLVRLLSELEINDTIPEELYEVVSEIFAFIYKIEKEIN
ncbi:FlhB-like flagellar biosynthesis protein [Pueribacillus sp. YX66]|uniref:FlhB-like flagellar biosynthesis protein n=1 Tax=Pueribacillus sp. YX66 TaxID=3229242 RepID=UPI00358CEB3B